MNRSLITHGLVLRVVIACFLLAFPALKAQPSLGLRERIVTELVPQGGGFPLVVEGGLVPIVCAPGEHRGVLRAVGDLGADLGRVLDRPTTMLTGVVPKQPVIIVGTLGCGGTIDALVSQGRLDVGDIQGRWETFVITTLHEPLPGVPQALVIAGSDKRGTIYGVYELCEQLGVSPWHWWADVPPKTKAQAFVRAGRFTQGEPAVRYRGIFLNDEAPCLTGWAKEKFGGLNSVFYSRVFELLLRLRANYLWPAMWDNAFNEDDPDNPRLADEFGIVMGTSHHEPMMRAHKEWTRRRGDYGNGKWNYATNGEAIARFFREGIARNKDFENLVTIGMRGDGDEAMESAGDLRRDIELLERVIRDQRTIIEEETKADASRTPQLWALFTEVTKYYEAGLRPPGDVTLLWTDDNVGNLRRLPTEEERRRPGGSGIYYHLDMHGGPFAYQWINTNPLPKIAEQMSLAYAHGADRIWIANVGDLKPLEIPVEFFLRMAWDPVRHSGEGVVEYTRLWAEREFGPEQAGEIAEIVSRYAKYNGWRKPELLTPDTFSQVNYREAEQVSAAWAELSVRAERVAGLLPAQYKDAYFQLVSHPVKASAIVAEINIAAGRNKLWARQGRLATNAEARRVRELFLQDQALSDDYNHRLAGGKWNHLMDQPHLGQSTWEPPRVNIMPAVSEVLETEVSSFGVAVEGDPSAWPDHYGDAVLPTFDSFSPREAYIDVFAQGRGAPTWELSVDCPWVRLRRQALGAHDARIWVSVDWASLPTGSSTAYVRISGAQGSVSVKVPVVKATPAMEAEAAGCFASLAGPLSFAASDAAKRGEAGGVSWTDLPDYGRMDVAVTPLPSLAPSVLPPAQAPFLEYPVWLPRGGMDYEVALVFGPVCDHLPERGVRVAVSFDDEPPQVLDLFADRAAETFLGRNWWSGYTRDNARTLRSTHRVTSGGRHTLRIQMVDTGVVLQRIVISAGKVAESYFGPPMQRRRAGPAN